MLFGGLNSDGFMSSDIVLVELDNDSAIQMKNKDIIDKIGLEFKKTCYTKSIISHKTPKNEGK